MRIYIRKKRWELVFEKLTGCRGDCDSPESRGKRIRISRSLKGEEQLEVLIHEFLHAAYWDMDEEAVESAAADIARALWKLGYRKQE